jgi:hypothetical protein
MSQLLIGTRSYAHDSDTTMTTPGTSVSTNTPDLAADYRKLTGWETTDATPQLDAELSADRTIDSLFFRHSNVSQYRIQSSPDGAVWSDIDTGLSPQNAAWGHNFEFTPDTKDYWRFQVDTETVPGNNTFIYEILWFEMKFTVNYHDAVGFIQENRRDRGGGVLLTTTGQVITYSGIRGTDSRKEHLNLNFDMISPANRNTLFSLWGDSPVRDRFVISPFTAERNRTFEAAWGNTDFPLTTAGDRFQAYFSGSFEILER